MTNRQEAKDVYLKLLAALERQGAYGHAEATSGSYYIAFHDQGMGAIRISDHSGNRPYRYAWNVWVGKTGVWTTTRSDGVTAKHYGSDRLHALIGDVRRKARRSRRRPRAMREA